MCSSDLRGLDFAEISPDAAEPVRAELEGIRVRAKGERAAAIRSELADVMMEKCGVYRDETLVAGGFLLTIAAGRLAWAAEEG